MTPGAIGGRKPAEQSDADLLRRFAEGRDESAFDALVARHGPLVLGSCWRVLRNRQDVEDAFQAVFLTLADRASSVRNVRSLSGWLYGVAVRVSLSVRRKNRQWRRAAAQAETTMPPVGDDAAAADAIRLLDEELARLPERYRNALVLCDLQGRSQKEAAQRLAVPLGTVSSRLVRGRKLLRDALVRRVAALSAAGLASVLSEAARAAGPASAELVHDTTRGALFLLTGRTAAGGASARVTTLVHEMRKALMLAKLKLAVWFAAAAVALGAGSSSVSSSPGVIGAARGGTIFLEDGSATDGSPVTWRAASILPATTFQVLQGDLRVSSLAAERSGVIGVERQLGDASVRAQARVEGTGGESAAVFARGNELTGRSYGVEIAADGGFWLIVGPEFLRMSTELRPTEEDIFIQVDVIGSMIRGFAWRANEPMPAEPLMSRTNIPEIVGCPESTIRRMPRSSRLRALRSSDLYRSRTCRSTRSPHPRRTSTATVRSTPRT